MKKKIYFVLLLILCSFLFIACNNMKEGVDKLKNGPTHKLVIENQSQWRVVVSLYGVKELYSKVERADYVICKKDDVYGIENVSEFDVYDDSDYKLLSVNGAKIESKTANKLVLVDSTPMKIKVFNKTGRDIILKNEPCIFGGGEGFYYAGSGYGVVDNLIPNKNYIPLFQMRRIAAKNNNENNFVEMNFFAWQLSQLVQNSSGKADEELSQLINQFAAENIKITDNGAKLKTTWKKIGTDLFLILEP